MLLRGDILIIIYGGGVKNRAKLNARQQELNQHHPISIFPTSPVSSLKQHVVYINTTPIQNVLEIPLSFALSISIFEIPLRLTLPTATNFGNQNKLSVDTAATAVSSRLLDSQHVYRKDSHSVSVVRSAVGNSRVVSGLVGTP